MVSKTIIKNYTCQTLTESHVGLLEILGKISPPPCYSEGLQSGVTFFFYWVPVEFEQVC